MSEEYDKASLSVLKMIKHCVSHCDYCTVDKTSAHYNFNFITRLIPMCLSIHCVWEFILVFIAYCEIKFYFPGNVVDYVLKYRSFWRLNPS